MTKQLKRDYRVAVFLNEKEKKSFEAMAERYGMGVSAFMRYAALMWVETE